VSWYATYLDAKTRSVDYRDAHHLWRTVASSKKYSFAGKFSKKLVLTSGATSGASCAWTKREERRVASERRKRARIAGYKPPSGTLKRETDVVEGKEKETARRTSMTEYCNTPPQWTDVYCTGITAPVSLLGSLNTAHAYSRFMESKREIACLLSNER
jgi:hypothetical protein